METTIINKKEMINAKNANDLADGVRKSFIQIENFVNHNDYKLNNSTFNNVDQTDLVTAIGKLSLTKRKELRNYLWKLGKYPTLETVNRYLQFYMKHVLKSDIRYKVLKSDKQLAIEDKRRKYKDALAIAKKAFNDYKSEKGDFYKLRLAKGQKI